MTSICPGGGASAAKAGVSRYIFMSTSAAGALLNNVPTKWAVPFAAYLGSLSYDATTFCTTDPPAVPTITALDALNILSHLSTPDAAYLASAEKFAQLVSAYAWYQFCECTGGSTPAPPSPPAAPTDLPQIDPTYLPPGTATACLVGENTQVTTHDAAAKTINLVGTGVRSSATGAVPLPTGTTSVVCEWGSSFTPSTATDSTYVSAYNAAGSLILNSRHDFIAAGGSATDTFTVPSGAVSYKLTADIGAGSGQSTTVHIKASFFCNSQTPSTPAAPCCPPDPSLTAKINAVLEAVTLIQRQIAPFGFIDGPTHTGLSGNNHITLAAPIIGLRVNLTTIPASYGQAAGDPVEHFDLGFVHLGNGDEWFGSRRLETAVTLWLPRWAGAADRIGYSLAPGVISTITELHREA